MTASAPTIPRVLIIVTGDPLVDPKPAEAVRVAAGVGAWRKAEITLYLRGPAVRVLTEFADELVDEDNFTRYLPIIGEWGRPVLAQRGAPALDDLGEPAVPYREIDDETLAAEAARHQMVLRF